MAGNVDCFWFRNVACHGKDIYLKILRVVHMSNSTGSVPKTLLLNHSPRAKSRHVLGSTNFFNGLENCSCYSVCKHQNELGLKNKQTKQNKTKTHSSEMRVFFLLPKQLVLFRELDVQRVLYVNISCRRHHREQRYIFYLFILYALREVVVREMKNCLKCHVWGCPLDRLKGVYPEPSACSRGHRL